MTMLARLRDRRSTAVVILATVNIGRGVPVAVAAAMLRLVFRVLVRTATLGRLRAGVMLGLQEIDEADLPDEHGLLHTIARQLAGPLLWVGWATAVPFTVPRGWRVVWSIVPKISDGRGVPKPRPHYPTRFAPTAMLEHKRTGVRLIRVNTHLDRDEFPEAWNEGNNALTALIEGRPIASGVRHEFDDDKPPHGSIGLVDYGVPILFTADRNRRRGPRLSRGTTALERSLLPDDSIDELRVIVPHGCGYDVQVGERKVYADVKIDGHDLEGRVIRLRKRVAA